MAAIYELHAQGLDGTWHQLDLGDNVPAFNFQANDIAKLDARQANYTQSLKLPLSQTNKKYFDNADIPDLSSDMAYKSMPCRLYCDGYTLAGPGSVLELSRNSDGFETQIVGGNAALFEVLAARAMAEIDLGTVRLHKDCLNPANWDGVWAFMAASHVVGGAARLWDLGPGGSLPFANFYGVVEAITAAAGYTLTSNMAELIRPYYLACVRPPAILADYTRYNTLSIPNGLISAVGDTARYGFQIEADLESVLTMDSMQFVTTWAAPFTGTVSYNFRITEYTGTELLTLHVQVNDGPIQNIPGFLINYGETDLAIKVGDTIKMWLTGDLSGGGSPDPVTAAFRVFDYAPDYRVPMAGATISIAESLGFESQMDVFKAFCTTFGLMVYVDGISKTVRAEGIGTVYANKTIADDWTSKMISGPIPVAFKVGQYAQRNVLNMEPNELENIVATPGVISVMNTKLEPEKELFRLPYEAALQVDTVTRVAVGGLVSLPMVSIPILTLNQAGTAYTVDLERAILPRLVVRTATEESIYLMPYEPYLVYRALRVTPQELADEFYMELQNGMLHKAKVIEPSFWLKPQDVSERDPFKPIYLAQFGKYFYINKIKNFQSNKKTTCELIKI